MHEYCTLELDQPIILKPGQIRAIYVHSTLPGDQAIVYDNASFYMPRRGLHPFHGHHHHHQRGEEHEQQQQRRKPRYEDPMLSVYTGRAHVSNRVFGQMPIWGWGNAWRDHREFVGQLDYGAVYQLWNPEPNTLSKFGPKFQKAFWMFKMCQTRWESPISRLPDECIYYILNMCRWDWFEDTPQTMKQQKDQQMIEEKERKIARELKEAQARRESQQADAVAAAACQQAKEAAVASTNSASAGVNNHHHNNSSSICPCPNGNSNRDDEEEDDDDDDDDDDDSIYNDAVASAEEQGEVDSINDDSESEVFETNVVIMSEDEDDGDDGSEEEREWVIGGDDDNDDDDDEDDDDDSDESYERAVRLSLLLYL